MRKKLYLGLGIPLAILAVLIGLFWLIRSRYKNEIRSDRAYLLPSQPDVKIVPILSVGDTSPGGYPLIGNPDGMGALDINPRAFSLYVHHENEPGQGFTHKHGAKGAHISRWIITKSTDSGSALSVKKGEDAISRVFLWDSNNQKYFEAKNETLSRLCSADIAEISAFLDDTNGEVGSHHRILLGGEENDAAKTGRYGRAFATVLTGPQIGNTYELPRLGRMAFENIVASPYKQRKTIAVALDDAVGKTLKTLGEVYVYVGEKIKSGAAIERAGLNNGRLFGISVENLPVEDVNYGLLREQRRKARFSLKPLPDLSRDDGRKLFDLTVPFNKLGITKFLRPEDGAWDPSVPGVFYFTTSGAEFTWSEDERETILGPGRLWRLTFTDIEAPMKGGSIELLLDGSEGVVKPDNLTVTKNGYILIQEDPGDDPRPARIWLYSTHNGSLTEVARFNPRFFTPKGNAYLTINEESSGIIDARDILGKNWFLLSVQSHVSLDSPFDFMNRWKFGISLKEGKTYVEDGQVCALYVPVYGD